MYFFNSGVGVDYRVLATDYDNWAIIHSCSALFGGLAVSEVTWVLTRAPKVVNSADFKDILDTVIPYYEDKIPHYPRASRMRNTIQGGACKYGTK